VIATGTPEEVARTPQSATGRFLAGLFDARGGTALRAAAN
jgi:excinuclease UvrABC ATPase subunit